MESEGLVESEMQPGPHGPNRRVYRLGVRGESHLRELLKDSIDVILHFYDSYRHSMTDYVRELVPDENSFSRGRILFAALPRMKELDLNTIRTIAERCKGSKLDILGDNTLVQRIGIPHRTIKGELTDIPSPNEKYSMMWLNGVPENDDLHNVLSECKRVLTNDGYLRMVAPFVFFEEPKKPTLGEFIRVTSVQLFPELGVTEGESIAKILEAVFPKCGAVEVFPGLVVFWAQKGTANS